LGNTSFESDPSSQLYIDVENDEAGAPSADRLKYAATGALTKGFPMPGNPNTSFLSLDLTTTNLLALTNDALPTIVPSLTDFVQWGGYGYRVFSCYTYKTNGFFYGFTVEVTSITPMPELHFARQGANCVVSWQADAVDVLESAGTLTGPWAAATNSVSLVNSIRSITFKPVEQRRFFRLKRTSL